jgi:hypothetical protein
MEIDRLSVWLTIPSAKAVPEAQACVDLWRSMGYFVALWRDQHDAVDCDLKIVGKYPGYATACNALIREVMARYEDARWCICAGDDIEPDRAKRADDIAAGCERHFDAYFNSLAWRDCDGKDHGPTFGVMQPTGDRWGEDQKLPNAHPMRTAYIDRVAASAWYGREYCQRMYGGNGPLFDGYRHMFVDEEAKAVAELMGVYWMRPDLTQLHQHWARQGKQMPAYLAEVNGPKHWEESKRLYEGRKVAGFPGHEPIPSEVAA